MSFVLIPSTWLGLGGGRLGQLGKVTRMRVLVIAPHPDDEVLGVGGTIHRLAGEGHEVAVAIVTKGWAPLFPESQVAQVRAEATAANEVLGTGSLRFMDLPVTRLDAMPRNELYAAFDRLIGDVRPDWAFLPFPGDRHEDHRQVFEACQVALRPLDGEGFVNRVMCYETVSETHWAVPQIEPVFDPHCFIDITPHLEAKVEAMKRYASQVRPSPDARSIEAVQALARFRGSVVRMNAAEAFMLVRDCWTGA